MSEPKPRIVVIGGPTASGKTKAALELAKAAGSEIVSADSVQVYRRLDIGSAKPTLEERRIVPHHLIDILDVGESLSAAEYARRARAAIAEIHRRGRTVVVAGGTGLYIRALTEGLIETPPADPNIRRRLREYERTHGPGALHARLEEVDPETAARLHPSDLVRIERALEVWEQTGRPISELHRRHAFSDRPYEVFYIVLDPGKAALDERIRQRVDRMYDHGLLQEVQALLEEGVPPDAKPLTSPGYKQAVALALGKMSSQEARQATVVSHRRYARRQRVWFRSVAGAHWYRGPDDLPYRILVEWLRSGR